MRLLSKYWFLISVFMALSACSVFEFEQTSRLCVDDNGNFDECANIRLKKQDMQQDSSLFKSGLHFVTLNEYTQQIALELKSDMPILGLNGSVIVLPFVAKNGLMGGDDILGHDLADYLTNDLSDLGVSTSEGSLGGYLYLTEQGHIEFSAEQQAVFSELNVSYVLTGYIRKTHSGLMLSTRIVELKNGKLVASSNKMLPNIVINSAL